MKKTLLTLAGVLALSVSAFAQVFEVESMERVKLPGNQLAEQAMLSPDGQHIVYTDFGGQLKVADRQTGTTRVISDRGSMMNLSFSNDGKTVVYRESNIGNDHLRRVAVKSYSIADGAKRTLVAPARNLQGVAVADNKAVTITNGLSATHAIGRTSSLEAAMPVVSIDRGLMYVNRGTTRTQVCPLGTSGMSYMWASVSPDGKSLLFYAAAYGTYTCKIDGSDLVHLGRILAPVWYGNDRIVGMQTQNDGRVTYEGKIVAATADGSEFQVLTDENLVAVLPAVADGKISFTTTDGELFIMNVK